jgi:hypothetical protein
MTSQLILAAAGSSFHAAAQNLPKAARNDLFFWKERLEPLLQLGKGISEALDALALATETGFSTVERKFHQARKYVQKHGEIGWLAIVDSRLAGPRFWRTRNQVGITEEDQKLVKLYCMSNQRSTRSSVKQLRKDWQRGKIKTETPIDLRTGYPKGWSIDNLGRYAPTSFQLKAVRIGRTAAASERPLVYTTRKGLYVGSHYMLDDLEHDFFVNTFAERQAARPLELFSHDLFSARKMRFGIRPKTKNDDGSLNKLTERMTRQILAATLYLDGYSPRGTVIVAEHGTAAVREAIEKALYEISDKKITVSRSGMQGAAAHAGAYSGPTRGNPRHKASLESSNNLVHNVLADLPGQTGKDLAHRPEQLDGGAPKFDSAGRMTLAGGLLYHNDSLMMAHEQLCESGQEDRAALLRFPLLEISQAHQLLVERYKQIEDDVDHDLEGWLECGHVSQEIQLGGQWVDQRLLLQDSAQSELALQLIAQGKLMTRPRRLSRGDVWRAGASELVRIQGFGVCAILGDDLAVERRVSRSVFEFEDREVGPGVHRYSAVAVNAHGEQMRLADGERYETFINPFAEDRLFVRRSNGSYIGECSRISKPCRGDVAALQRRCGEVAREEAELLAPVRETMMPVIRERKAQATRNVRVLRGNPVTKIERNRAERMREIEQDLSHADKEAFTGSDEVAALPGAAQISVDDISDTFGESSPQSEA